MRFRLILFIILSAAIMLAYQYYFMPKLPPVKKKGEISQALPAQKKGAIVEESKETEIPKPPILPSKIKEVDREKIEQKIKSLAAEQDRKIEVDTELLKFVFSEKGAYIEKIFLKKFKKDDEPITLFEDSYYGALFLASENGSNALPFIFEGPSKISLGKSESRELIFKSVTEDGIEVEKRFKIDGSHYTVEMLLGLRNDSESQINISEQILLGPHFFLLGEEGNNRYRGHVGPVIESQGKVIREKIEKLKEAKVFSNNIRWTGLESKYFLASIKLPEKNFSAGFFPEGKDKVTVSIQSVIKNLKPLESIKTKYSFYFGPKYYSLLEKNELGNAVDFGWFGFLGKPLLIALNWIYSYIGNYGLSIIIITIILKIIFIPLTQKSFTSMQKMKEIQPQIKAIRDKYKKDPKKMNEETMALYKEYGVNPMGGCLPMIFQIPVFIAFYNVLLNSVELRGAPFIWWITDLSQKDPYYITPILMGITMLIQQRMTPSAGDPRQAQIMMIMPVVFTFMFMSFPVGLVIYWTVNNILTIGQQYFLMPKQSDSQEEEVEGKSKKKKKRRKGRENKK
ncbi:MAG: membrane protein insertase YidC [Candidatus Schekmanbacteria bacterium]|nr:MAG: membrane protein insertase YidC [Candidatus Schekmanbacteria bacterium]